MRRTFLASAAIAIALTAALVIGAFALAQRATVAPAAPAIPVQLEARSRDGALLAIARNSDSSVRLVSTQTHKTIFVSHLGDQITSLHFANNGTHIDATVRDDAHVRQIDTRTGAILVLGER